MSSLRLGAALWNQIAPEPTPDGLRAFETIQGAQGSTAPATQRDLLFWIHGGGIDDNLDRAFGIDRKLAGLARLELDQQGFVTRDSRDLTGFIDGTANPKAEAAREAALIPPHRPGAGGAFVLSQRLVHDLQSFLALPVPEQERVFGRTKPDNIEFEADAMPVDAHVARTDVTVDGVAQKILRRSVPFGSVAEHGLYFLAFSAIRHGSTSSFGGCSGCPATASTTGSPTIPGRSPVPTGSHRRDRRCAGSWRRARADSVCSVLDDRKIALEAKAKRGPAGPRRRCAVDAPPLFPRPPSSGTGI